MKFEKNLSTGSGEWNEKGVWSSIRQCQARNYSELLKPKVQFVLSGTSIAIFVGEKYSFEDSSDPVITPFPIIDILRNKHSSFICALCFFCFFNLFCSDWLVL